MGLIFIHLPKAQVWFLLINLSLAADAIYRLRCKGQYEYYVINCWHPLVLESVMVSDKIIFSQKKCKKVF